MALCTSFAHDERELGAVDGEPRPLRGRREPQRHVVVGGERLLLGDRVADERDDILLLGCERRRTREQQEVVE